MAIKNKTRYAILGVLCMKPCSGYDIKKFCDKTISHFWNENFGHIYPVLKKLQEEQMISMEDKDQEERRKIYHITEKGLKEFKEWLIQPPELLPPRSELMLKLSFGNYMPKEHVLDMLAKVKERNSGSLELYKGMEASYLKNEAAKKDPAFPYWLASLRLGIINTEATLLWCNETTALLTEDNSSIQNNGGIL
jgi:PadR family transcriptional regulator, regulatory protein AphA